MPTVQVGKGLVEYEGVRVGGLKWVHGCWLGLGNHTVAFFKSEPFKALFLHVFFILHDRTFLREAELSL